MANSIKCATKYPVVLSHGMAAQARIAGIIDNWRTISETLENNGADVYVTSVNAMDSNENKAPKFYSPIYL